MKETLTNVTKQRLIIKKCHVCGQVHESSTEIAKCINCNKSFLPLNYFVKVHEVKQDEYSSLFAQGHELEDEDLIKGIYVLW